MQERTGVTRFKDNPVTLLGPELKVGGQAPDFLVVDSALTPVTLATFQGKTNKPDYAAVLAAIKTEIHTKEIPGDGVCG